ncbi:hypothetical protein Tco_1093911 [Tanacetum coccineum]|uniref:Uncharacterized protein n=1 Tax=Tanacetum coccineum TaxID=301880 RepID=A0ABQ5IGD2_9ASTR
MSIRELQEQVDALAQALKQYCSNRSWSCCEGPHNGGNCPNFFNQSPQYRMETYSLTQLVYEPNPGNNYDFPCFDQPPQYHVDQSPPQDLVFDSLMHSYRENNCILEEILRTQMPNSPVVLKEPEGRENDEFIKSSVDDLVPIPMESEITFDSDLECDMPATTPLPPTDVKEEDFDINLPLGEYVVDFLMENMDVAGLPRHLVILIRYLVSYDVTFLKPLFDFNDEVVYNDFLTQANVDGLATYLRDEESGLSCGGSA